jgi:amidase
MIDLKEQTILQFHAQIKSKKLSITELVQAYLDRIQAIDQGEGKLNSILEVNPDALSLAKKLDEGVNDSVHPLYGIPILLKDNIDTKDRMHTSSGSYVLKDSFAKEDATLVTALREKGAVILGKTNMTEFANHMTVGMPPGYSSRGGQVISPYGVDKDPSGSSTGSGVATSANLCCASIGTDTSGSIVSPSMANSLVGFRPSLGAISQKGIIPISFTMDVAGPMTRTVMDTILLFNTLTNQHVKTEEMSLNQVRIGIDQETLLNLSKEEEKKVQNILDALTKSGAKLKRIRIPRVENKILKDIQLHEFKYGMNQYLSHLDEIIPVHSLKELIAFNETHAQKTLRYGQSLLIDAEEKTIGDLSEPLYKEHLQARESVKTQMNALLTEVDVCMLAKHNLILQFAGLPIITIPHGLYDDGSAAGVYFTGIDDCKVLQYAYLIERVIGQRVPPSAFL